MSTVSPLPPVPQRTMDQQTFTNTADTFLNALPTFQSEINVVAAEVNANAVSADADANTATTQALIATAAAATATSTANATAWVNGNTYILNQSAISQIDFQTYRKKTASSVTTIDPKNDPANWTPAVVTLGSGGTVVTGVVVLTNTSGGSQAFATTNYGQAVVLPDATTMQKGASIFNIANKGEYDLAVKDNSGAIKGFVRPFENVIIGLSDNSSAAGVWAINGAQILGVVAQRELNTQPSTSADNIVAIPLDATRTLLLYGRVTVYAQVCDKSTNTWGAPVTVTTVCSANSGNGSVFGAKGIAINSNLVLVAYNSTTGAGMRALTLSISGTTITVNAEATTASVNNGVLYDFIQVGSSYVMVVYGTNTYISAMTVSGTTVTMGTAVTTTNAHAGSATPLFVINSTTFLAVGCDGSTAYAQAYALTGATISSTGTQNALSITSCTFSKAILLGSGRVLALFGGSSGGAPLARLYSVSGVTISATNVTLALSTGELTPIASNKALFTYSVNSVLNFAIITDTSGTVSLSSVATANIFNGTVNGPAVPYNISGTTVKYFSNENSSTPGPMMLLSVDASGATPVVTAKTRLNHKQGSSGDLAIPANTDVKGNRSPVVMSNNTYATVPPSSVGLDNAQMIMGDKFTFTRNTPTVLNSLNSGSFVNMASGQNTRETWQICNSGSAIALLEMAQ